MRAHKDHIDSTSHYVFIKNHCTIGSTVCEAKWIQILMDDRKTTFCPCEVVKRTQSIRYAFHLYRFNYADHQKVGFRMLFFTLGAHLYYWEPFGNWPTSLIKTEKLITVTQLGLSSLFPFNTFNAARKWHKLHANLSSFLLRRSIKTVMLWKIITI